MEYYHPISQSKWTVMRLIWKNRAIKLRCRNCILGKWYITKSSKFSSLTDW